MSLHRSHCPTAVCGAQLVILWTAFRSAWHCQVHCKQVIGSDSIIWAHTRSARRANSTASKSVMWSTPLGKQGVWRCGVLLLVLQRRDMDSSVALYRHTSWNNY